THTGMPAVKSGSGGPKVPLLKVPSPTGMLVVHMGSSVVLQPSRQSCTFVPPWVGKLCDGPLRPLSGSVPGFATDNWLSLGWSGPPEFAGHRWTTGDGSQDRFSLSLSFFGLPLETAFNLSVTFWRFFPLPALTM